ncbi:amylo-alpha-1,6-glucosidase [Synechococcus sp. PCC 7336]|uniref:amylo-alpha-1,6-glucosidase n=1 Tax=Synechococcus sp. PCC 7336 TaxID=195250 RepID=UPI0003455CD4|nr:amylo-alpha-1,6-glucosidase [Synechococcus sp. PCC 7336]
MTIRFGRAICGHLSAAGSREWLVTNGIGGYACGTIAGHLTRHYHGLLVAALDLPLQRHLLLTRLEETATDRQQIYPLYTNCWADGAVEPRGDRHIESFQLDGTVPHWTYAIADARLHKRIWMQAGENTTYINYSLQRTQSPIALSIKVLVNYRDHHGGSTEGDWQIEPLANGICVRAFPEATPFYILAPTNHFELKREWYRNYSLAMEQYRGTGDRENHLHAATLNTTLRPGESLTLAASTQASPSLDGEKALGDRRDRDTHLLNRWQAVAPNPDRPDWSEQLVLAADQFIVARPLQGEPDGQSVIAGYPWFSDWGRDLAIALPGLAIATGRPELARPILRTFARYLDRGMLPNVFPESGQQPEYNTVDAVLWYFEAVRAYVDATDDIDLLEEVFPALAETIDWHRRGTRYNIHLDPEDGLIYAGEPGVQLTWMDAKVGDWVVTPRTGKPIEIQALWYNALAIAATFARQLNKPQQEYRQLAEQCARGFQRFWSDSLGYCFDVLNTPDGDDSSLRPNQIFAVALPYKTLSSLPPLLAPDRQKAVVDTVARHLLTSYGLRSLSPTHPDYRGHYGGDAWQRDGAYHQGTVWGWLLGPFTSAHLAVYNDPIQAREWLAPIADHLADAGLGSVSEIFDGDPPHTPRGCFAQAWSVAEILRVWTQIEADRNP